MADERLILTLSKPLRLLTLFLPWCGGTEVTRDDAAGVLATIQIDYRGLRQRFSTLNVSRPHESISMRLRDGPFARLDGEWRFLRRRERWARQPVGTDTQYRHAVIDVNVNVI